MDPAILSIIWQRLIHVAEEQAKTLVRVSFTSQSGEMQDIASAVFDSQGNMLAEGITGTVGVITALLRGVKNVIQQYPPEALMPGDVLIGNDPWIWSGHTFDLAIVRPVFLRETLIGFAATITHLTDIGGKGWGTSTVDIYEEGIRIPIIKLFQQGKLNQDILRILRLNVRTPDDVEGDILAQVAATEVGSQRLLELMLEYGLERLEEVGEEICGRSEAAIRQAIRTVPPGVYREEVLVGGFGAPLKIVATIKIEGDRMEVDYAGTSPQINRGVNSVYNYTLAHTVFSIKCALCPDIPNNEGTYKPINVLALAGSVLNATPPAALVSRHVFASHINRVIFGALAQVIPDRVIADCGGAGGIPSNIKGIDAKGKQYISMMANVGSMGAAATRDGYSVTSFPANIAIYPAEILENRIPILILGRSLVTDSGGPGKFRGGLGMRFAIRVEGQQPTEFGFSQTQDFPAKGRLGGRSGDPVERLIDDRQIPTEEVTTKLKPGEVLIGLTAGGGGFYPPEDRDPKKVLEDVVDGYVSVEKAREIYKVAIHRKTMEIDWEETRSLRAEAKFPLKE